MSDPIVLVSHGFQPSYEKGYANGLASNGVAVDLVGSDRTLYSELHPSIRVINLRGSQDPKRSRSAKALNLLAYVVKLFIYIIWTRPRVLHLDGMLLGGAGPLALIELMLYRLGSKRLWLTVHNLVPHDKHDKAKRWILRRLYRIPHVLIVHTQKMKRDLIREFDVPESGIVVMEHGIDDIPGAAGSPSHAGRLRVLLFGGVLPYKGVDIFLQALHLCREISVDATIAGEARNAAYASEIERLIGEVPEPHCVNWDRRFIPEQEVNAYFERADVVAMPYRHIDQSGVLFTAYRFGAPVVCFDVGAFRDYVPEYAGIVVPGHAPRAFAEALRDFSCRVCEFDRNAIQAYARAFLWENTVRVLLPYLENSSHMKSREV